MAMECAVDHVRFLGYPLQEHVNYDAVIDEGPKSPTFTELIAWLTGELQVLCELESCVHPIKASEWQQFFSEVWAMAEVLRCHTAGKDPEDSSSFLLEVSSFLKDIYCPHSCLMEGPVSQRLLSKKNKILLIEYLCTELEAARIIAEQKPPDTKAMKVEMQESTTAKELKEMLMSLSFSKPPPTVTPLQLFSKVEAKRLPWHQMKQGRKYRYAHCNVEKVADLVNKYPSCNANEPLFCGTLTERQWFSLEKLQNQLYEDYGTRREMLLKRLDVTIQSFNWSERLKNLGEKIEKRYLEQRRCISSEPGVNISDLLAARKDLALIEKTSSSSVRQNTKSSINNVVIGAVPDRGGRPEEQQPPPPEVPSWQKNEPQRPSGMGGGRGGDYRSQSNHTNIGFAGGSRGDRQGTQYCHGGNANYDRAVSGSDYGRGVMRKTDNYHGGWNQSTGSNFGAGYSYQSQPPQYAQPGYLQPSSNQMPPSYYSSGDTLQHDGFGIGMGGYAATGGNFYQYGAGGDYREYQRGGRGGRGPGGSGGRSRGGRRGGPR